MTEEIVRSYYPILAGRVALRSSLPIDSLVKELLKAMNLPFKGSELTGMFFGATGRMRLFKVEELIEGDYDWKGRDWSAHVRGKITNKTFAFDWWWDFTMERGGGFLNLKGDRLEGEWWLGQEIDGGAIPRNNQWQKKGVWSFHRLNIKEDIQ